MDSIFRSIKGWICEQEEESRRKRFMRNMLRASFELMLSVFFLCIMAPTWEHKGFFPSIATGALSLIIVGAIIWCVINSLQALVRALQLFNEYRYDKKCGYPDDTLDEE